MSKPTVTRPSLSAALSAWQKSLAAVGLPAEVQWIFPENLCIEKNATTADSLRVGFDCLCPLRGSAGFSVAVIDMCSPSSCTSDLFECLMGVEVALESASGPALGDLRGATPHSADS